MNNISQDMYLEFLFSKETTFNDPSLPNPFNFRNLKIDTNITNEDWKHIYEVWKKSYSKGFVYTKGFKFLYNKILKEKGKLFILKDGKTRVSVVGIERLDDPLEKFKNIFYSVWIHGKNYASASVMRILSSEHVPQKNIEYQINTHPEHSDSIKVAYILKPNSTKQEKDASIFYYKPPFWWNNKKYLKYDGVKEIE